MYISLFDQNDKDHLVHDDISSSWNTHWSYTNDRFERQLDQDLQLHQLKGKMFFVYKDNHRLTAWMRHISDFHNDDPAWHIAVDCIILDARGKNGVLLNAMADVNW